MVRDDKLCGYVFARTGKGITWGYMVPIEPVFNAIKKHWSSHFGVTCSPEIPEGNGISVNDPGVNLKSDAIAEKASDLSESKSGGKPKDRPRDGELQISCI